ncbi:hypothetical protein HOLleu_39430 [Holothuria leucospilota]|uniref:Dynamin-like GTPase OPA1, mitochondrial n=1 Tax=Holothuria leucospilota TaxID=206669 RepID=A0A9Q0YNC0_HOLLE|nr:hypothetical protein HOLleu_39430 [Holothuria leucospilota]
MAALVGGRFGPICGKELRKLLQKRLQKRTTTTPSSSLQVQSGSPTLSGISHHQYSTFSRLYICLRPQVPVLVSSTQSVSTATRAAQVLRLVKIRYVVIGSAVAGGATLKMKYESWKERLPDMSWLSDLVPDSERSRRVVADLKHYMSFVKLPEKGWLKSKVATIKGALPELKEGLIPIPDLLSAGSQRIDIASPTEKVNSPLSVALNSSEEGSSTESQKTAKNEEKDHLEKVQDEFMEAQLRYQREIERLEKENKRLKKSLLLRGDKNAVRKEKKSLIDMYSEVLDTMADFDDNYKMLDHLPRVVVVGDQSSGKTSVLEMIAQARIFPRGAGEMMTRSPVKVTLSEGPDHIAQFNDSGKVYDLTKETELKALRKEIELRMKGSVQEGRTISTEVISLSVRGPGIQRMVLVDLPGMISTVTTGMAADTKNAIQELSKRYMNNPNAIILCIQDGAVDAERSIVTDLVSSVDPSGKRTIFVLTKVDLAEKQSANPSRIRQILEGRLFPMKALGYFAVVTGKGNTDDSISTIRMYEEQFFRNSQLFKSGTFKPNQMNTQNLSFAVSDCFWKMVRESVEQQADIYKASRFNLETEWKNNFSRIRELDRDELFERAKGEILDEVLCLSEITPKHWEEVINTVFWNRVAGLVFEGIYIPSAQSDDAGTFNTSVDIKLKQWAEQNLPQTSVEVGREALMKEFDRLIEKSKANKDSDVVYDKIKSAVKEEGISRHKWQTNAVDSIKVIQLNALEDRSVHDRQQWDEAISFMENTLKQRLKETEAKINEMNGPGTTERWTHWKSLTQDQVNRRQTQEELEKLFQSEAKHKPHLSADEITTVKKNLQTKGVDVENEFICETWHPLFRKHFLQNSLSLASECRRGFYHYQRDLNDDSGVNCHDVVLFWRIHRMVQLTSNVLRQQIMNTEARRLEKEVKQIMEDYSDDRETLEKLLTGRRVDLAEELKKVRHIQEKLEEFIAALQKEKV